MSDIDAVVVRVRFALEHPNDDVVTVGDVTSLLAAYESAVRERDEARASLSGYKNAINAILDMLDREAADA